jgi:potassium/hydrogen antiporter
MVDDARLILAVGAVLTAGVAAAGLAARLRLPALVLFAGLGMLVGSDGLGWIAFDDYRFARLIGTIALVLILFEGGLIAGWQQLRPVLRPALLLAVIGTLVTAAIVGLAASSLFDFSLPEGLLLGAILAATDGAAVFALLRGVRLPSRIRRTLEGESGLNDPVAVLLVLVAIDLIVRPHYGASSTIRFLVREIVLGVAVGAVGGQLAVRGTRLADRLPRGLVLVGSLAAAALAYGIAGALGGSGFLAVYLVALALGDAKVADREPVIAFHRGLAMVAEIGMFFALGLLVFPSQFGPITVKALLLALITAVIARPVASTVATVRQGFTRGERVILACAGLRGAVPIVLATFAVIERVPRGIELLNIVFFAVLLSAALQGAAVQALATRISGSAPLRSQRERSAHGMRRTRGDLLGRLMCAHVEPELRVAVGHRQAAGGDAEQPSVHPEHEVVDRLGMAAGEEEREPGDQHQQRDHAAGREHEPRRSIPPERPAGVHE